MPSKNTKKGVKPNLERKKKVFGSGKSRVAKGFDKVLLAWVKEKV